MKLFFAFFTSTFTFLSICSHIFGDNIHSLVPICEDIATVDLITLPVNRTYVTYQDRVFEEYNYTNIRHSPKGSIWVIQMFFTKVSEANDCVSILYMSASSHHLRSSYILEFNPDRVIGLLKVLCKDDGDCTFQVQMRSDVLTSPPFSHTLDEPTFWDFSSSLFSVEQDWLQFLSAEATSEQFYPFALSGLSGTSLKHIELNGFFGTDPQGLIPRLNNIPLLQVLTVTNSPMVDLPSEYLAHSDGIIHLSLQNNKFHEVPKAIGDLKNLTELKFGSLMENFILNPYALDGLDKLENLTLSGSRIEHWTGKFGSLPSLIELNLSRCKMRSFCAAFQSFPELRRLDLSENFLTFLTENAFIGLSKLVLIDLSQNNLSHLSPNLLIHLHELNRLSLESNNLTDWPKFPCNSFNTINMSNNHLTNLINLGQHIRAVQKLDISNNNIFVWKDQNIFKKSITCGKNNAIHFGSLKKEHESLTNLYDVPKLLNISFINISNNLITIFSEEMIESLSTLYEVDIGGNMIDCANCQTLLLQHWLFSTRTKVKNLGRDTELECQQPKDFKNRMVQDINFEICFIPHRYLWLGIGAPTVGVISIVVIGSVLIYYRTEVAYLVHLAKVRATSKKKTTNSLSNSSYDAFVCYSGNNRKWVLRRLVPLLERCPESYVLCLFDRDFKLGSHIVTNIVDAIEQSRKVIVVLTQKFIDSKWCQWELEMAQHKLFSEDREFLVLLVLEPLERRRLPRLLRFLLDTRPVVRWPRPETAPAVMAAAAELRAVLGPSLRQHLLTDPPPLDEPWPSAHERTPLLDSQHTQVEGDF